MVMIDKSLPEAAVAILQGMSETAVLVHLDPGDLMTWGMEGIASVCHVAGTEARLSVRMAIEESFMGAGEVFGALCENRR
jgi:hypothetical protein